MGPERNAPETIMNAYLEYDSTFQLQWGRSGMLRKPWNSTGSRWPPS